MNIATRACLVVCPIPTSVYGQGIRSRYGVVPRGENIFRLDENSCCARLDLCYNSLVGQYSPRSEEKNRCHASRRNASQSRPELSPSRQRLSRTITRLSLSLSRSPTRMLRSVTTRTSPKTSNCRTWTFTMP